MGRSSPESSASWALELLTVSPCVLQARQHTLKLSHFHEGLGQGEREVQELRPQCRRQRLLWLVRRRHHGQGLSPSFGGKRKKTGQTEAVRTPRPAAQPRLFRQLALLSVTI